MNDRERGAMVGAKIALKTALTFFVKRDEMNSEVHLQTPRWSPITEMVRSQLEAVEHALEHEGGS